MSSGVTESHVSLVYYRELVAANRPVRFRAGVGARPTAGIRLQQSVGAALVRFGASLLGRSAVRAPIASPRELVATRRGR